MEIKYVGPHHSWNKCKKIWDIYYKDIQPMLQEFNEEGRNILPSSVDRFKAFELGLDDIKVVMLGQDPYPTKGHAHGLSFSVQPHVSPLPGSLRNIFKEASSDLGEAFGSPRSGDLGGWHSRGVFLYNAALTVEEGKPLSHQFLWRKFTYATLSRVSRCKQPIAWLLFGKEAQQYKALVPEHHLCICTAHPSPLSCRLFYGTKPFSRACDFLNLPYDFWRLP